MAFVAIVRISFKRREDERRLSHCRIHALRDDGLLQHRLRRIGVHQRPLAAFSASFLSSRFGQCRHREHGKDERRLNPQAFFRMMQPSKEERLVEEGKPAEIETEEIAHFAMYRLKSVHSYSQSDISIRIDLKLVLQSTYPSAGLLLNRPVIHIQSLSRA